MSTVPAAARVPVGATTLGAARARITPRRLPLRATGLLAIVGIMILALLLVASALLFRAMVQDNLAAIEQADAQYARLLQRRLNESGADSAADSRQALDRKLQQLQADRAQQLEQARQAIDGGTVTLACLAWFGITSIGALALLFFSRLAIDIGLVRARALAILTGERGHGRSLVRNDELSDLARAVDHLAEALDGRERDLAIERRHVVHQERLAAIGAMAAGVLREIGNPIAAIDGYARALLEAQRNDQRELTAAPWFDPAQILRETARLVAITHDISALAAAPASQLQLVNLNEVVTQSLALLRYERRLERITVVSSRDPQAPAVLAVADRLVLLLINLVINAADATAALEPRTARIEVAIAGVTSGVELSVSDNGCGMSDEVRARAFEPLFTTKPAGRGTGLGLPLCRSIAHDHGGRIEVDSVAGKGTRVTVWLPVEGGRAATLGR